MLRTITMACCCTALLLTGAAVTSSAASESSSRLTAIWSAADAADCHAAYGIDEPNRSCAGGRCSSLVFVDHKSVGPTFPMACRPRR
jgi:hypothetical protein